MDTNEPQAEQSQPQSDSSSGCGGSGQKSWKTAVFIAVLVLAGAVAAHSVLTRNGGLCGVLPCGMGSSMCSLDKGNGNGGGGACTKSAVCASEKACCPLEEGDGNGNGDGGGCAEKPGCPFAGDQGCCANKESCPLSDGQGAPPACCPMAAPTGCCPASAPQ